VINTDVLIDLPLADVLAFHKKNNAIATLVLRPDPQADHYGSIDIDSGGRIERFLQARRPKAGTAGTKLMFTGVQVLEPKTFQHMEMDGVPERFSTTKDLYPAMLLKDEALYGFCFEGYWQDLGTPERIRSAEERLTRNTVRVHYL